MGCFGSRELDAAAAEGGESVRTVEQYYNIQPQPLGRGHYATVYPAQDKRSGEQVAVKVISKAKSKPKMLRAEIDVLQRVGNHPNIVHLIDVFETPMEVKLVMEVVSGGELFEHLINQGPYSEKIARHHIRQIAQAIQYLHQRGIVHRDLKPENILLSSEDDTVAIPKVADFGLAKITADGAALQTSCGTWAYAAPEVRSKTPYTPKVDSWSLGVIMFVLLSAYHPFDPDAVASDDEMWERVKAADYDFDDPAWDSLSAEAKDLISNLIVIVPEKRYDMDQALDHPWMTGDHLSEDPLHDNIHNALKTFHTQASAAPGEEAEEGSSAPAGDAETKSGNDVSEANVI